MSDTKQGCTFRPRPEACLNCPFDDCHNSAPPQRGEDGVENYLPRAPKERKMITRYSLGDIVLVPAKVERIEIDEGEITYFLSSEHWEGFETVEEKDLAGLRAGKPSKKTSKASEKAKKAEENGEKRQKVVEKTSAGQQDGSGKITRRQQGKITPKQQAKVAPRQQERSGAPLSPLGKELAKELAELAR